MGDLRKSFGRRLKRLRVQKGMSQEELAAIANLSVDFLSLIERGVNSPSFSSIEKLADALDMPVRELFRFDEEE